MALIYLMGHDNTCHMTSMFTICYNLISIFITSIYIDINSTVHCTCITITHCIDALIRRGAKVWLRFISKSAPHPNNDLHLSSSMLQARSNLSAFGWQEINNYTWEMVATTPPKVTSVRMTLHGKLIPWLSWNSINSPVVTFVIQFSRRWDGSLGSWYFKKHLKVIKHMPYMINIMLK